MGGEKNWSEPGLTEKQKEAWRLYKGEDLSVGEVAEELGIKETSANGRLEACYRKRARSQATLEWLAQFE
ncbi:helix-turn-helix transcriptional regulator [Natronolimnobius baerhuensis]|uniref:HTH luxR-type domain-containing protein n=1 Tax=Natronolimnobius baerhuensis TaxID=253108 RepID=A0A202E9X3_9EURY|nr:hypothetical protein [Natronolimnobius baerhuensis]OVE85093.1 hypothetical protein B2G88_12160 [Natronolimnobius baerhuensis]